MESQSPVYFEYTKAAVPVIENIKPETIIFNNHNKKITTPNLEVYYIDIYLNSNKIQNLNKGSSHIFYVIEGEGITESNSLIPISWKKGDVFTLPYLHEEIIHNTINEKSILFYANDSPLLKFLDCVPNRSRFLPTIYKNDHMLKEIEKYNNEQDAKDRNRNGILLSNNEMVKEKLNTLTHTMWSLLNSIGPNSVQKPHRHNSIAVDLCTDIGEDAEKEGKVYTLMGKELDNYGNVKDPIKMFWKKGCTFTTPPGWWHSHHNESQKDAWVFPVQDAGLHTYMRTLNIEFVK